MVHPKQFIDALKRSGITFFTGVPDSLLKDLLAYIEEQVPKSDHITAANEGNAVGIAAGYHLASGKTAAVYLQNSGLGNAVNPLTSLADKEVYSIPVLLIVGWRGEPGVKDEPQHIKQGRITAALLNVLEIPHAVITPDMSAEQIIAQVVHMAATAHKENRPVALVVRSGVFEAHPSPVRASTTPLTREAAIERIVAALGKDDIVVSTTGKISRELYEVRRRAKTAAGRDFLTVGSMGHASQIALGIASQKPDRIVWCIDGDGSTIMHMGALATVGWVKPHNFKHIVLNNLAHESVGGQPSAAGVVDLPHIARASGYEFASVAASPEQVGGALAQLAAAPGPAFLEIIVNLESRKDLARPAETPAENKKSFMKYVADGTN